MIKSEWLKTIALDGRYQGLFFRLPLILLLTFVGASLWHSFAEHVGQAENKALTLARAVEQHATATLDRSSLALLSVSQRIQPGDLDSRTLAPGRRQLLNNLLVVQQQQTRGVVSMSITDAQGIVLANSVGTAPGVDLSQRHYFQQLKTGHRDGVVVSEVIKGKVSNRWGLQVARRIDLPDGSFGGMVVANLGLYENFERFYETLDVGRRGIIALRAQDSTLLVRFPVVEAALGKAIQGSRGTQAIAEQVSEQVVRSISPIDQVDRITTVRKLPDYPIYTLVGIAYEEVIYSWLRQAATLLLLGLVALPLTALVSSMARHRLRMLEELRAAELALAREREDRHELMAREVAARTVELRSANRQLESFLYAASHDLKGPLGRISSFSTLLEKRYRDRLDGDGQKFLDFIRDNARRLTRLIDNLLQHARVDQQQDELKPADLADAVQATVEDHAEDIREAGAVIMVQVPSRRVLAAPCSLKQVLDNLLENALKYSAQAPEPRIEIGGAEVDGRIRLWVRDNGIGFDMEYHDKIFEIFRRLHTPDEYAGSGIGLALVKRAMERMGGRVWAEAEPGQGATFYLEFALAPEALALEAA